MRNSPFLFLFTLALGLISIFGCKKDSPTPTPQVETPSGLEEPQEGAYIIPDSVVAISEINNFILTNYFYNNWNQASEIEEVIYFKGKNFQINETIEEENYLKSYELSHKDQLYQLHLTNLPIIEITTESEILDEPKISGKIQVHSPYSPDHSSELAIEIRGISSQSYDKKSYGFELRENADINEELKVSLLDMRNDGDWILDAMFIDPLKLRNSLLHKLWIEIYTLPYQDLEPEAFSSIQSKHAELFINGDYRGLYALNEKIDRKQLQVKKYDNQVKGEIFKTENLGLGNFTSIDDYDDNVNYWGGIKCIYPDLGQFTFSNLYELVDLIVEQDVQQTQDHIEDFLYLDSAVDYFLFTNLIKGLDNFNKNIILARYNADSPYFFCVWDIDAVLGLFWEGFYDYITDGIVSNGLFDKLIDNNIQNFNQKIKNRWSELRLNQFSYEALNQRFKNPYYHLKDGGVYQRESLRWDVKINDEDLEYLQWWIEERLTYLDNEFNP